MNNSKGGLGGIFVGNETSPQVEGSEVRRKPRFSSRRRAGDIGRIDFEHAYELMARMRSFEAAQADMWDRGLIAGELHTGIGEEGIVAGVVANLVEGDALAIDHRSTPPLVARGVDMEALFLEMLGSEEGLNRGQGGHMHLFAPEVGASSDGIVGSGGPLACGLALGAQRLQPGRVAVALFGEGAANQGMMLESWNLAAAWRLPVVFVCKDNGWSITTLTRNVTGGGLKRRAGGFGLAVEQVDGWRVRKVAAAAADLIARARSGNGPGFLLARCHRPQGHFMGDPMLRIMQHPREETRDLAPGLATAFRAPTGERRGVRLAALTRLGGRLATLAWHYGARRRDPLAGARRLVDEGQAFVIEARAEAEVAAAARSALARVGAEQSLGSGGGH